MSSRPPNSRSPNSRPVCETMEERILHSADLAPLLVADAGNGLALQQTVQQSGDDTVARGSEIAFVDLAVPDAGALLADLRAQQAAGRALEIVTIGADQDGLALISQTLASRSDIGAVHVLAHGSDGVLQLGNTRLDASTLMARADTIAAWSGALVAEADLMLYGCDFAQSGVGQQLVRDLALLTGADVAASTDLTGAAALGGDWALEYRIGTIDTALAVSAGLQQAWQGVMATYTVTSTADVLSLPGTLRWAISQANGNAGTDTIVFATNGNFVIGAFSSGDDTNAAGDLDITGSLNLVGNGAANTVITGNGLDRVIDIRSGTVTLSGLTIEGGSNNEGGGLRIAIPATVTLSGVIVQDNQGAGNAKGAGIYNEGDLTLQDSIVQRNGGTGNVEGGGIYNKAGAALDMLDVEIRDNTASGSRDGGGLYVEGVANVTLRNVTFEGNQAHRGGGLYNHGQDTQLFNVTFSGNSATNQGGAIWADKTITLDHVTVANNSAASTGGTYSHNDNDDAIRVTNSLFAGNVGGNASNNVDSRGYNLSDDASSAFDATGDRPNVAAGLLALADNGGITRTHAVTPASAARNAANPSPATGTDQRGVAYVGRADIGAYEYDGVDAAPTITSVANQSIDEDVTLGPLAFTIGDAETASNLLVVTATSSNQALLPDGNLVLGGSGSNRSISLAAAAGANSDISGGPATITLSVYDGIQTTTSTFTVTVLAVNDAPTLVLPASATVSEDTALVLSGAGAPSVGDIDAHGASLQLTLVATSGLVTLGQTTGLAFVSGTGSNNSSMIFSGTVAAMNAALDGLRFVPNADYTGSATLSISVDDLGHHGSGGAKTASAVMSITVTAVNDAPVLVLPGPQSTPLPMPLAFSPANGNAITVTDVDAAGSALQLTLARAGSNGTLSFGSDPGALLQSGNWMGDTLLVLQGSRANLDAALADLLFTATAAGAARIDVSLDDLGNTGAGGPRLAAGIIDITVGPNALPLISLSQTGVTYTENAAALVLDPGLTVSDVDHATLASATIAITAGFAGAQDVLSFANDGATMGNIAAADPVSGVLTLSSSGQTATLAQWQAALRAVRYINTSETPAIAPRTLSLVVNDGIANSASRAITLDVNSINDAPVLSGANDMDPAFEDAVGGAGTRVAQLISGHLADVDEAALAGIAVIAVDDTHGTWQYTRNGGLLWTAFSESGVVSDGDARLLGADAGTSIRFVPQPNWNGFVPAGLRFRAWDQTSGTAGSTADTSLAGGSSAFSGASASSSITVLPVNDAPLQAAVIADQVATQGTAFSFAVPAGSFTDVDGDTLSYTASGVSGAALPQWLSFDAATRTFSGTPGNADVRAITVRVTATDSGGLSTFGDFGLTVVNVNDAPTVDSAIADQAATQDAAFTFTVPAGTFDDIDVGDTLVYSAMVSGGGALPAWLGFDAATRTFSGTPANADVGTLSVRVTATDTAGASVVDDFALTVANINDAPAVNSAITDQAATQGAAFHFTVPAGTFGDIDVGDTLVYSAMVPGGGTLPAWLGFDAATRTFSGTPANADVGTLSVRVTATDTAGASVVDDFALTVANVNDAPTVDGTIADRTTTADTAWQFQLPAPTFSDPDIGDNLVYTALLADGTVLPAWLSFDAQTRVFSGLPGTEDSGVHVIRVVATDASGAAAQAEFAITVATAPAPAPEPQEQPDLVAPPKAEPARPSETTSEDNEKQVIDTDAGPTAAPAQAIDIVTEVPTTPLEQNSAQDLAIDSVAAFVAPRPFIFNDVPTAPPVVQSESVLAAALSFQFGEITTSSTSQMIGNDDLLRKLEELKRQMLQQDAARQSLVASSIALTSGLSIGYVVWLIRGGILVSSMLSALPAWQLIDPLPVLANTRGGRAKTGNSPAEDPEVEQLFDDKAKTPPAPGATTTAIDPPGATSEDNPPP